MAIRMTPEIRAALDSGLLRLDKHTPLLERLDHWCRIAGVQTYDITTPMKNNITEAERNWVKQRYALLKTEGKVGLLLIGPFAAPNRPDIGRRMRVMTAGMMRQMDDARILMVKDVVDPEMDDPAVLLVPDSGMEHAPFTQRDFSNILLRRSVSEMPTVLHVENTKLLDALFDSNVAALIQNSYRHIEV